MNSKRITALLFAFTAFTMAKEVYADLPTQMAPVKVRSSRGFLESEIAFDPSTKQVRRVVVTWTRPGFFYRQIRSGNVVSIDKYDLRIGDIITLIDDRPVGKLSLGEASTLLNEELKPGEKRSLWFEGKRGLFGHSVVFEIIIVSTKTVDQV